MFPWLRLILVHLWVACIAGAAVTAGLVMGNVSASTFLWAAIIGLVLGIPAGLLNWMWLRPNRSRELGWTNGFVERVRQRL